ncbi:MAG: serine/threonine-protein kinase [Pseudomonadota bacterium]
MADRADLLATKALYLAPDARARMLAEIGAEDQALRDAIEALLAKAPAATGDLVTGRETTGGFDAERWALVEEAHPETIGPYRIVGLIGAGGMGRVYRGEQVEPVRRQVAIKVLQNSLPDPEERARFLAEQQVLARLTHPNIAQLYEAGTTAAGFPYFAMEFVEGLSLTEYADQLALTIDERLDLFRAVCDGVAYAHLKGILHRDLKPSNILVAEYPHPQPKIIDFGIATATDSPSAPPDAGQESIAMGTAPYMSPEAVRKRDGIYDVDLRSDVYALGVILFELLTGRRPYERDGRSVSELVEDITRGQAPRPSEKLATTSRVDVEMLAAARRLPPLALRSMLREDLDWIVLKAIAADREDRYSSVSGLSADLRRYLRHEPVSAHPPSLIYRSLKFVRRHRASAAAGALGALAIVAGFLAISFGLLKSREAERTAVEYAQVAEAGRASAEQTAEFLLALFLDADPYRQESGARGEALTVKQLLDQSAERLTTEGLAGQPQIRARLMNALAQVYLRIGETEAAEPLLLAAYDLRLRELSEDRQGLAELRSNLGFLDEVKGRYGLAEEHYRGAHDTMVELLGPDHPEAGVTRTNLAKIILTQGKPERAEPLLAEAVASARRTVGESHPDYTNALNALAFAHYAKGEYPQAESYFRETLVVGTPFRRDDDPSVAVSLNNLAMALERQGKIDEAEQTILEAIDLFEQSLPPGHWRTANAQTVLAACETARGRYAKARDLLEGYFPVVLEARGNSSPYAIEIRSRFRELYEAWGRPEDAARYLEGG